MKNNLKNYKVAMLVSNGFEQSEMEKPKKALEEEGAVVVIISPEKSKVKGWKDKIWGDEFKVDMLLEEANANDFLGLVLPGGVMNPDQLRLNQQAINFIKAFIQADKPIAAICHGPWPLIDADYVKGKTMTSWPSLKLDLKNAGANWVDKEVVRDQKLITSRKPDDLPAFNQEIIKLFNECK
jgi:protease I